MPARKAHLLARSGGRAEKLVSLCRKVSALRRELLRGRGAIGSLARGRFVRRRFGLDAVLLRFFLGFRLALDLLGLGGFGCALVFAFLFAGLVFRQSGERGDLLGGARRSGIDNDRRDRSRLTQQVLWRRRAQRGDEIGLLRICVRAGALAAVAGV